MGKVPFVIFTKFLPKRLRRNRLYVLVDAFGDVKEVVFVNVDGKVKTLKTYNPPASPEGPA